MRLNFGPLCPSPSLQCNSVPLPHSALSWILSKVENLACPSLKKEAIDLSFLCVTWRQLNYQSSWTCISECVTPSSVFPPSGLNRVIEGLFLLKTMQLPLLIVSWSCQWQILLRKIIKWKLFIFVWFCFFYNKGSHNISSYSGTSWSCARLILKSYD